MNQHHKTILAALEHQLKLYESVIGGNIGSAQRKLEEAAALRDRAITLTQERQDLLDYAAQMEVEKVAVVEAIKAIKELM